METISKKTLNQIKKSSNPKKVLYRMIRDNNAKRLKAWFDEQKIVHSSTYNTGILGLKENQISIYVHTATSKIEDVIEIVKNTDFKPLKLTFIHTDYTVKFECRREYVNKMKRYYDIILRSKAVYFL